jgi:tRNA (cmo5U34)-methyltransferase
MAKDELFAKKQPASKDFDFGEDTAAVFDDMLVRSVPFYAEVQRMIGEMAADFGVEDTRVYDLGCSLCTTFLTLDKVRPQAIRFVGIDFSPQMLERGRRRLAEHGVTRGCELVCADWNEDFPIANASVAIMNLTLQFVRPVRRNHLIQNIARGLNPGGCLLLVEKVLSKHPKLNRSFIKYYYDFKQRNGYSELEIAQKREALENVLVPYRLEENIELLLNNGFKDAEVFFRWYNFCGLVAIK